MTAATFANGLSIPVAPSRAQVVDRAERIARQIVTGLRYAAEAERRYHAIRQLHALDDETLAARGLARDEIAHSVYWLEFAD